MEGDRYVDHQRAYWGCPNRRIKLNLLSRICGPGKLPRLMGIAVSNLGQSVGQCLIVPVDMPKEGF